MLKYIKSMHYAFSEDNVMAKRELTWEEQHARKKKWKAFWDKITTGLLILLMAAPFAILAYIFYWFLNR